MKKIIFMPLLLVLTLNSFAQDVELCGSINSSSEQRFKTAYGIGLQSSFKVKKISLGVGLHYNFKKSTFNINTADDAFGTSIERQYTSNSNKISGRFNIQLILMDNETYLFALGPEISYNILRGHDNIDQKSELCSCWTYYDQELNTAKKIGYGAIVKFEFKELVMSRLSLVITIRPEFLYSEVDKLPTWETPDFPEHISFTEFQIGLKYLIKK